MQVIETCNKYNRIPAIQVRSPALAKFWIDRGMKLVGCGADLAILWDAVSNMATDLKSSPRRLGPKISSDRTEPWTDVHGLEFLQFSGPRGGSGLAGGMSGRRSRSPSHAPSHDLKKLLKQKRLSVECIKFRYKMSGNVMICQVLRAFSLVLGLSHFTHSYSVFVFNDLRRGTSGGRMSDSLTNWLLWVGWCVFFSGDSSADLMLTG